jgi:hypothetical protein
MKARRIISMRIMVFAIFLSVLFGCNTKPDVSELELYKEQRIQVIAKDLVREGRAANMDEALERAKVIVDKEISDQKDSSGINSNRAHDNQLNVNSRYE